MSLAVFTKQVGHHGVVLSGQTERSVIASSDRAGEQAYELELIPEQVGRRHWSKMIRLCDAS